MKKIENAGSFLKAPENWYETECTKQSNAQLAEQPAERIVVQRKRKNEA